MDNKCCHDKKSYHFDVTQVVDGKIQEVMNFNLGGNHDLAELVQKLESSVSISDKHAKQLICGLRLLHHVVKKYPDNPIFKDFSPQLDAFKAALKAQGKS